MIDRLLIILQQQGLLLRDQEIEALSETESLLHDEDIADALWLASKIGGTYEIALSAEPEESDGSVSIQVIDDNTVLDTPQPSVSAYIPPARDHSDTQPVETPEEGLPIQVQAAPALANPRDISRSLRPLMRKVPSLTLCQLDEAATVNRIAERDIWVPILKPSPERWFDLELVIEASKFSFLWQDTLDEFQQLLESQGAFRNVRTWYIEGEAGQPKLVTKKQRSNDTEQTLPARSYKELVDTSGRRLVLLVSDCRSLLWQQGQIHNWLALWGKHGPAAIVQLLPERLWSQSELDVGFAVQVSALIPGAPNPKLQVRELPTRAEIASIDTLTVPVVTLTPGALRQWALVVSAAGRQRSPARLFDLAWVKDPERDRSGAIIRPRSAKERVELFKATASPVAQRLAGMMAAVPVDLPVVHLIQQELLKEVQPIHIAEVYTSGLLEEVRSEPPTRTDPVRYDFVEDVRGLLNKSTPLDETLGVLEALSQRIARTLGFEIRSFTALLSPKAAWSQETKNAILPFAQVATEVLRRLGGDYAELAQLVERDAQGRSDWIQPIDSEPSYPDLKTLNFITAQLESSDFDDGTEDDFPRLQTEEFTIATIIVEPVDETLPNGLQPFEFTVATIERNIPQQQSTQELKPKPPDWIIHHERRQAYQFFEPLNQAEDISLEMVAIPGGDFLMGSPEDEPERVNDEAPQHEVSVQSFFMARYPVTQAQWRFVAELPQVERELKPDPSNFKGADLPVEQVSWYDAVEFCARLSQHSGREYRLPTEAEWEYACRAGTTTPFHFGQTLTADLANYDSRTVYNDGPKKKYREKTTSVGQFDVSNAFGLCDMHGNVWEWCQDHWHENYEGAPTDGSAWIEEEDDLGRILRGGSWIYNPRDCRSAYRTYNPPDDAYNNIGFRVVCGAPRGL